MFNVDEILAELATGKSIEEIAQNAADTLNAAKTQHDKLEAERKAKEEAARKAAEAEKKKKIEHAEKECAISDIMADIADYFRSYYPRFFTPEEERTLKKELNASVLVDTIDEAIKTAQKIAAAPTGEPYQIKVDFDKNSFKEAQSAIDKFLKENGLF